MNAPEVRQDFGKAAIQGTAWKYLTFFSGKVMVLISTAILARLLTKDDFGVVGYAITTINFLDIASDMGVGAAIIYHSEDSETSSTAFWLNILVGLGLFGIAWVIAPYIALYFRDNRATEVIRILSLVYPIGAIGGIHRRLIEKKLAFNRIFLPEFLGSMTKGSSTIIFALVGLGAWSVILGQLCSEIVSTFAYWFSIPWHPKLLFNRIKALSLLDYGTRYVGADAIAILLLNLDYLLVGRYLGPAALGVYTIAFRLPDLIVLQFARTLSGVIFPVYSRMRETSKSMAKGFVMTTRYISLITVPMGLGLALVAKPFTEVVFSDKWVEAVPAIQGIAIYSMLLSLAYNAGGVYKASGRPQIIAWLGLARLALLFPALWWAVTSAKSIVAVSWMHATVALASALMSFTVAARILDLKLSELFVALYPAMIAGAVMTLVVLSALLVAVDAVPLVQLSVSVASGGISYFSALWFFQREIVFDAGKKLRSALGRG